MHVLVIGGSNFMGLTLVWRLLLAGHRVTVLNRGRQPDPFADRVERLRADRGSDEFDQALAGREFDRVVDLAGFTGPELARAVRVLGGRVGHYLFVSTGQVYLVREGCPRPSREVDYDGPVMAAPPRPADHDDWRYGVDKRAAEDVLVAAGAALPSTRLRLPMVVGERDPKRRFDAYLWRLLDGGPVLVAGADARARHLYRGAVVDALLGLLAAPPPPGQAFNLAPAEDVAVGALVAELADRVGARAEIRAVDADALEAAGLSARAASPFSTRWMSLLDPGRAMTELGFVHPPRAAVLDRIVADALARWDAAPPPGYDQRAAELRWAGR